LLFLLSCNNECKLIKGTHANKISKIIITYPNCSDKNYYKEQHFYDNGQLSFEGYYRNEKEEGRLKTWNTNGVQTAEWEIINGKEHGFIQCWYDTGIKKKETNLKCGIRNGNEKHWYESGKQASEGSFVDGKEEGVWKFWEKDDDIKIRTYKEGVLSGPTSERLIDSTGVILVSGQYEKDKEVGVWKWYTEDSVLHSSVNYENGKANGDYYEYYPNGIVKERGRIVEGEFDGEMKYFNQKGELERTEIYKSGKRQ
jgi:antitoxin component YwqK of YwqJK toxin-antitoxin module